MLGRKKRGRIIQEPKAVILSDAAWAWEGLRRNPNYRKAWEKHQHALPTVCDSRDDLRYIQQTMPCLEAETYGLIIFADPDLPASEAPVFWRPDLLCGTLSVRLKSATGKRTEGFSFSSLNCFPTVLDTPDGHRHIRFGGHSFWIQLLSDEQVDLSDEIRIFIMLSGQSGATRRLKTAEQLLSLHKSEGQFLPSRKRPLSREKLLEGLLAWDVQNIDCEGAGSLRDIAISLFGEARVQAEWVDNRSLKDRAIRARNRGQSFVAGGYISMLRKAAF